jgi:integrase
MNRRTIYGHFVKAIEKANLPHMTFHQLRHMNASVMEQLGVPLLYAKERFGHDSNSPVLMRVYQHTFKDKRAEVDQTINSYFSNLMK